MKARPEKVDNSSHNTQTQECRVHGGNQINSVYYLQYFATDANGSQIQRNAVLTNGVQAAKAILRLGRDGRRYPVFTSEHFRYQQPALFKNTLYHKMNKWMSQITCVTLANYTTRIEVFVSNPSRAKQKFYINANKLK